MGNRISVVEDEPDILDLISCNPEKEGFHVSTCLNGEETLQRTKKEEFNLMILDLMLPGIQRTELCKVLKTSEETSSMPIIISQG